MTNRFTSQVGFALEHDDVVFHEGVVLVPATNRPQRRDLLDWPNYGFEPFRSTPGRWRISDQPTSN